MLPPEAVREAAREVRASVRALRSFAAFSRQTWHVAQPGRRVVWGWHLEHVAQRVQHYLEQGTGTLVVCLPVGSGKSTMLGVQAQPWDWLHRPNRQWINISSTDRNASRDSRKSRMLITSPEYQRIVALSGQPSWKLTKDQNEKVNFVNTAGGARQCFTTRAEITGADADVLAVDDPLDAGKIELSSPESVRRLLSDVMVRYDDVWTDRMRRVAGMDPDAEPGVRLIIAQRLHPLDPPGHMIARRDAGRDIEVIVIPEEYDPDVPGGPCPADPRTTPGELLQPAFRGLGELEALSARKRATRYNQRPSEKEGAVIAAAWLWERYRETPRVRAATCDRIVVGVDLAFTGRTTSDYCVAVVLGIKGAMRYVLHVERAQIAYPDQRRMVEHIARDWRATEVVVERAANGDALLSELREVVPGIRGERASTDKTARLAETGTLAAMEAGQVLLPEDAPWLDEFVTELTSFPAAAHDDQVDALVWAMVAGQSDAAPDYDALGAALAGMGSMW